MRFLLTCAALCPIYSQITSPGFEPNRGDYPAEARFVRRSGGQGGDSYYLTRDGLVFRPGLGVQILNVPAASQPVGESPSPIPVNLYRGSNPAAWRTNQHFFEAVRIADIGQGASALFTVVSAPPLPGVPGPSTSKQRITLNFPPGADPDRFTLRVTTGSFQEFEGPDGIWFVGGSGGVFIVSGRAFQAGSPLGLRLGVASGNIGLNLSGRDPARNTQVEIEFPNFELSFPSVSPVPVAGGPRYVTGVERRLASSTRVETDIVLSRLDKDGRPLWISVLGGSESDSTNFNGSAAAGDAVVIAGTSESTDLPLTSGGRAKGSSRAEPFLAAFRADTGTLSQSTFTGVDAPFSPNALAVSRGGEVVAGGQTSDERGFLVRWQPAQNRLRFSLTTALPVRALVWDNDENFYAASVRPAAAGLALEGYNTAGAFGSRWEIASPEPVGQVELLPATLRSYYVLFTSGTQSLSMQLARIAPRDEGLIFVHKPRLGFPAEYVVAPDGGLRMRFSGQLSPVEPTSANARLVAACPQSSYYVSFALDGSLRYATYVPSGPFDLLAQTDGPAAPAPRLVCAAATAGREPLFMVSPGQLVTLTGAGFGPTVPVYAQPDSSGKYPASLAGYQVRIGGQAAPVIAVGRGLMAVQTPFGLSDQVTADLTGPDVSGVSLPLTVSGFGLQPTLFDTGERVGPLALVAALNQDGTVNSAANPATAGSVISVFGSGLGEFFTPVKETGGLNPLRSQPVSGLLSRCGAGCSVVYFGAAPGLSTGIFQANLRITPGDTLGGGTQVLGFAFRAATDVRNLLIMGSNYGVWVKPDA